ncbi:S1C family serine protease [Cellulosimicrobium marinum]|uniref:S1C family serine protease n=1 Tax=Cellulosimicrobium marinum TaxID=1638992 RepID=UPI001E4C158D|nr:trypsin-like peptidase domain-containing protein [Cellulosimicrobium marinum]MCB7136505.1 trypsin-like peptidase domain-containing protein [Cellulosimicrobium marinum]
MTEPVTGGPEPERRTDVPHNPFAPPSAYRAGSPVPPPSAPPGPDRAPATGHDGSVPPVPPPPGTGTAAPAGQDPWGPLRSFGDPYPASPVHTPVGPSVDPTLVAPPNPAPAASARRRGPRPGAVVGLVVLALAAGALGGVAVDRWYEPAPGPAGLPAASVAHETAERPDGSVADIAATVLPSVVSLEVRGSDGVATGSGFVLRDDGYILTNNHVVAGAAEGGEVTVLFADGHESPAELVGRTVDYDLAVVKVEDTGLTPLALADSDEVVVGDPVVAVGAPLGLNGTVTTGIVSALNRPVQAGEAAQTAFINAIQTDAAINPGNSGGPLVDGNGQVVGINSAIAQPPGATAATGSIGLGFAIPSNQARRTAEQLIADGVATYPVIGVLLDQRYQGEGVQVSTEAQQGQAPVTADGPADAAGVRPGDVILAIDGRPVTDSDELIVAIRAKAPGDTVVLRVRTGEQERDLRVVLDEATSE